MKFFAEKVSLKKKKIKVLLSASSGSGKTYGALRLAYGMTKDWSKIFVIDTERGSSTLYKSLGDFMFVNFEPPYTPQNYIEAIKYCNSQGAEVIIIDSITHEWSGKGGCLDIHASYGGKFQDWAAVTPMHLEFIDAICSVDSHVICTVRRKEEHILNDQNGKKVVEKKGLAEQTRDGFSYEMDIVFEIDNQNNLCRVTKNRTQLFKEDPPFLLTEETGNSLLEWANIGISELDVALIEIRESTDKNQLKVIFNKYKNLQSNEDFLELLKLKKENLENK